MDASSRRLRPRRRELPPAAALLLSCLCASLAREATAEGLAAHFCRQDGQLQAVSYPGPWDGLSNGKGLTVQAWIHLPDALHEYTPIFAYGVRNPLLFSVAPSELGLEMRRPGYRENPVPIISYKGETITAMDGDSSVVNVGDPDTHDGSNRVPLNDGYLVHVTATIDYVNGAYAVYLNGTRLYGGIHPEKGAPAFGGEMILGAEFVQNSARSGQLVARRPACMTIDDFRIFDRALSATEVAASLSANAPSQGLLLSWEFDAPFGDIEEDMSGNGNHGRRGAVPDLSFPHIFGLEYEGLSTIFMVPVVFPRMVMSSAPSSNANETSVRSVALVPTGREVALRPITPGAAAAVRSATVVALPSGMSVTFQNRTSLEVGSVVTSNDAVLFSAPSEWPGDRETPMELLFSVDGEQKATRVYPAKPCEPPNKRSLYMKVDEWRILSIGGVCDDGVISQVEVIDQPTGGDLKEILNTGDAPFAFQGRIEDYQDIVQTGTQWTTPGGIVLSTIIEFPYVLPNNATSLVFVPFQNLTSPIDTSVRYRWLSDYASSSVIASAPIRITPRNQPPALISPDISVTDGGIDMQLRTRDADGSPAGEGAVIYEIVRGPRFGTLRQVGPDKETGGAARLDEDLRRFDKTMPTMEHMASIIPDFDAVLGPAWSSQDSACGECCWKQETCNEQACGLSAQDFAACMEDSRTIHNILGEELGADTVTKVFSPHCSKCGRQWFVFGIEEPLYVMSFKIYMFGVRGIVSKISAAESYEGSQTPWVSLYESELDAPAMKTESVFVYEPQVCQFPALKAKYFRVEYDTDLLDTLAGFHAVKVEGSLTRREDALWNKNGRLWYQPTPGIYLDQQVVTDDFEVVANDCIDSSQPVTVKLPVLEPIPMSESSVGFGRIKRVVSVELGTRKPAQLDISAAADHLYEAFGNKTPTDFTLEVQLPNAEDGVRLYQHDSTPMRQGQGQILDGIDSDDDGKTTDANDVMMVQLSDPDFHFSIEMPYNGGLLLTTLHFTAASHGVLYHIPMIVTGICPENSLPTECVTEASVCKETFGDNAVFNLEERRCDLNDGNALSRFRNYLFVLVCVLLISLVVAAYCIFRKSLKGRLFGPPGQGEKVTLVITDIHGSTSLWENFPGEMAVDIALHHECLRASLRKSKGYEIATEGDSFKCAFRTPEDAICWSIVAQMDLLCAPWNESLEDGGQGVLNERDDWANMERNPIVSEHGKNIIDSVTSSEVMETTRTLLRQGLIREPLFSPSQAASTEFSRNWVESKGIEATCIHSSAKDPIPVFRGLRVRMGIHSGLAERVKIHELTKRYVYNGDVSETAKAVSDAPCGGQIIMSGETLAAVGSLQELQAMVSERCAGWRHGEAAEDKSMPAAVSMFSLGSHIIKQQPETRDPMESVMLQEGAKQTDGLLQSVAVDIIDSSGNSETLSSDSCVRSLEDESMLPAFGQTTRLFDLRKEAISAARSTLQKIKSTSPNASGHRRVRKARTKSDLSSQGQDAGQRVDFGSPSNPDMRQLLAYRAAGSDTAGSESAGPEIDEAMDEFRRAHELIMIVPWMLKTRAMYYPPPTSIKALTPSWDEAPAAKGVTILFTFIERWQKLKSWSENYGSGGLTEDLKKLQAVVRYQLVQHHGYEVEGEDGNFVCAFHSPVDAVPFAVAIQEGLLQVNWSEELLSSKWCNEERTADGKLSFRGMRLAIGMCTGNAMRAQPCVRTGKMEYYGPIMNHAARVATAAHGGQVLMHEATWQSLIDNINYCKEEKAVFSNMGKHNLKGIAKMVYITQAIPRKLQSRAFPPIKTLTTRSKTSNPISSTRESAVGQSLDQYLLSIGAISKREVEIAAKELEISQRHNQRRRSGSIASVSLVNNGLMESIRGVFLPSSPVVPRRTSSFKRMVKKAMHSNKTLPSFRKSEDTSRRPRFSGGSINLGNDASKVLNTAESRHAKSSFEVDHKRCASISEQDSKRCAPISDTFTISGQSYVTTVSDRRPDFHLPPLDLHERPALPVEDRPLLTANEETS